MKPNSTGSLYVVATPIGNAEDIGARAIRILREAHVIACEDTRRTGRLLSEHTITTPMVSYFEHNEARRVPELIARMEGGETIALVTDAGTPALSDPGYRLVQAAIAAGLRVSAVPGPSAVVAALSIAGLPTDRFVFEGFLPTKPGDRKRALERMRSEFRTIVFYEAARRLVETLESMIEVFGDGRAAVVTRELTKTYEEIMRGSLVELRAHFIEHEPLGEVTIVVAGASEADAKSPPEGSFDEAAAVTLLRERGLSLKDASEVIAKLAGTRRRDVYKRALQRSNLPSLPEAKDD